MAARGTRRTDRSGVAQGLDRFAAPLDSDWIEEALRATGTASLRRRTTPAVQAVRLALGMALRADRSIQAVHLGLADSDDGRVAPSAVVQARSPVGAEPLRWLFERVARMWADTPELDGYRGLAPFGVEGTHLRVPDSDESHERFGRPGGRAGSSDAGYPQLRVVTLMNVAHRLLTAVRTGPFSTSEQELTRTAGAEIPNDRVTVFHRGFLGYMNLLATARAAKAPASRMSFRTSLRWIRDLWTTGWMSSPGNVSRALADLRGSLILPERSSERGYPRHVKTRRATTLATAERGLQGARTTSLNPSSTIPHRLTDSTRKQVIRGQTS
jgi:hypothetical protein